LVIVLKRHQAVLLAGLLPGHPDAFRLSRMETVFYFQGITAGVMPSTNKPDA
jgi:hypothetical protein